jgi:outer membrane murein-binding lipoprotein Lpp
MNATNRIILWLSICAIVAVLAGCEEQSVTTERQERLYSAENMELKKQIAELEKQFEKDLAAKQKELDRCNEDKIILGKQAREETAKILQEDMVDMLSGEIQRLEEENARLTAEIEALKKNSQQQE